MPRYRMLIEYDGGAFSGWQVQPGRETVQGALEAALAVVLKHGPTVIGSGRTDAGVHARGQVAHFEAPAPVNPYRLQGALNGLLPRTVAVLGLARAEDDFHARYDARQRCYRYYVSTQPCPLDRHQRSLVRPAPNFELMNQAAHYLVGTHPFHSFCRTQSETRNRVCTVVRAGWIAEARAHNWYFEIMADRFLHGMVRAIVGTLLDVGRGKQPPEALPRILAARDRRTAGPAAPPQGLVLEHVAYETALHWPAGPGEG